MSLVYRAIWQDDRAELCGRALEELRTWVHGKYAPMLTVPDIGTAKASVFTSGTQREVDISVEAATSDTEALTALRATLVEAYVGGSHWKTTLRAWQDHTAGAGFAWVDLSVVGEDINVRTLAPAAPRLVRTMLSNAEAPRVDTHPIWLGPRTFTGTEGGEELAELVSDFERTLPTVVFARDDTRFAVFGTPDRYSFDDVVARVADRVAGVANIAVLDPPGADAFTEALGNSHGCVGGRIQGLPTQSRSRRGRRLLASPLRHRRPLHGPAANGRQHRRPHAQHHLPYTAPARIIHPGKGIAHYRSEEPARPRPADGLCRQ
ncbi:hypothetical protein [Nocardia niigatensis]|uniref:hypothetical protein n=1 Tax=Nocardia niigatensis TaxID=209249 RepID=UPI0012F68C01|nr:hypothetical protein [Nocardia niigatensis]